MGNIAPFFVGQRVVALSTCRDKFRIEGNVYKVMALHQCKKCGEWKIDIGERYDCMARCKCSTCGTVVGFSDLIWWHHSSRFAPIQEAFQSISLSKILEEETKLIGVN